MKTRVPRSLLETLREIRSIAVQPALLLWSLYVLLFPIYVFKSGVPQPGDLLVLMLLPVTLWGWDGRLHRPSARALRALALFTLWVIVVNYTWAAILGKWGLFGKDTFILVPTFYLYNAAVFLVLLILYQRYGSQFLWLTLHLVLITAVLQVLISFVYSRSGEGRPTILFNNPNQLGFYGLLSASILTLGRKRLGFGATKSGIGILACVYLCLLSASKAATLGTLLLFAFAMISNPRAMLVTALLLSGSLLLGGPMMDVMRRTHSRATQVRHEEYSFFEQRGYDRITSHKEYWLLGAGEGGLSRFKDTSVIGDHELHSAAGTLFFCYGVVGTFMFLGFLWRVVEGASWSTALVLVPALAYSLAHQGLRFTLLWVLLGMFIGVRHHGQALRLRPQ
jgi:hypothetical protein